LLSTTPNASSPMVGMSGANFSCRLDVLDLLGIAILELRGGDQA